jgi:anti-anti-sigma factor
MLAPDILNVTAESLDGARLVRVTGEIDMSSIDTLRRELDAARNMAATVLLDMSRVTFIDSTGLHLLLETSRDSAGGDGGVVIVRPSGVVQRLLQVSGTADLLMNGHSSAKRAVG